MRAKPRTTASGIFSRTGTFRAPLPIRASAALPPAHAVRRQGAGVDAKTFKSPERTEAPGTGRTLATADGVGVAQHEGLLHDARNLMNALGLYCDLLSLPGVLKREHLHYAEELRLLGDRSGSLIDRLMLAAPLRGEARPMSAGLDRRRSFDSAFGEERPQTKRETVSLREIVERCSGLLSRIAGGRTIEVTYGPASSVGVQVSEEDVERILVNLVRNAAAARDERVRTEHPEARGRVRAAGETPDAIRIGVGLLQNRVGDERPWPFRRVRLTVEDSGCGMAAEQVERLLRRSRAPARGVHGIGFCVVRELVAAGGGDLRVMSAQGVGTRVQIEWPVTTKDSCECLVDDVVSAAPAVREGRWPVC